MSQTIGTGTASTYSYLGTSNVIVKIESSSATTLSAIDAVGDRVATSSGGSFGYLLGDLHGNGAAAFNAAGTAISDAFAYDAWGVVVASVTSALPTPWRYQGRILESAAGTPALYDFKARSYNPALGTFTSLDTKLGSAQNPALLNGYLYADANPATLVDPDGHMTQRDDGGSDVATQGACGYDSFATHCGNGNTSTILKPLPRQTDPYVTGGCGSDAYATHCGDGTRTATPFITGGCGSDAYATHCNDGSRVVPVPATQQARASTYLDDLKKSGSSDAEMAMAACVVSGNSVSFCEKALAPQPPYVAIALGATAAIVGGAILCVATAWGPCEAAAAGAAVACEEDCATLGEELTPEAAKFAEMLGPDVAGNAAADSSQISSGPVTWMDRARDFAGNLTKLVSKPAGDFQAHHVFPVKWGDKLAKLGIDINKPQFGAWAPTVAHNGSSWGGAYEADFGAFMVSNPSAQQVLNFGRMMGAKYGFDVNY